MNHIPFQNPLTLQPQQPADAQQAHLPLPKPLILETASSMNYQKKKALKIKALLDLN